jgi:hypothetical protein
MPAEILALASCQGLAADPGISMLGHATMTPKKADQRFEARQPRQDVAMSSLVSKLTFILG